MPSTLQDIAARAGVSKMTVSLVLNSRQYHRVSPKTRSKIEKIAQELNYRPNLAARQLSGKRSAMIGVLMPRNARNFDFHRLQSLDREAMKHGLRLMAGHVSATHDDLNERLDDLLARDVDGFIWMGHREFPEARVLEAVNQFRSVVLIGQPESAEVNAVTLDYTGSTQAATEHLIRKGRRCIAMALEAAQWFGTKQRLDGYGKALNSAGGHQQPVVWKVDGHRTLFMPEANHVNQIVQTLAIEKKADAIIANNDLWASDIIKRLRACGLRVPDDVAVVGQDNSELAAHFDPPITSIDLQPDVMAAEVMQILQRGIENESAPVERRAVQLKLVLRESTGDMPAE